MERDHSSRWRGVRRRCRGSPERLWAGDVVTATVGSLVSARGRDWVVLPGSDDEFYLLRPLGGGDDDIAGVFADEGVTPARFDPPRPDDLGDDRSARLL